MANGSIKLSQAVVDQQHTLAQQNAAFNTSLGGLLENAASPGNLPDPGQPVSWELNGSALYVHYTSGAVETYANVVRDDPLATSGHATATGYTFDQYGAVLVSGTGTFNFDYKLTGDTLSATASAQGHRLTGLSVATKLLPGSAGYDPVFGNVAIALDGNLTLTPAGDVSGTFSKVRVSADAFLYMSTVDGNFHVDTASADGVDGTMTASYRWAGRSTLKSSSPPNKPGSLNNASSSPWCAFTLADRPTTCISLPSRYCSRYAVRVPSTASALAAAASTRSTWR
jgi:hypothetical protein